MGRAAVAGNASASQVDWADSEVSNEVRLFGRVTGEAIERTLPSGDVLVVFRVTVARPAEAIAQSRVKVDTIDCVARRPGVRRTVATWCAGDEVAIEGSLRRRFWKGTGGLASRYEVEVNRARRVAKAG